MTYYNFGLANGYSEQIVRVIKLSSILHGRTSPTTATRYSGIDDSRVPWRQICKHQCWPLPDAQIM